MKMTNDQSPMTRLRGLLCRWAGADREIVALKTDVANLKAELAAISTSRDAYRSGTFRLLAKLQPFRVVDAENPPPWSAGDAEEWTKFQRTGTGQRLLGSANFYEQATNRAAVSRLSGAENNTGYARGWSEATRYFFHKLLSADIQPQSDDDTVPSTGAAGTRERYAP